MIRIIRQGVTALAVLVVSMASALAQVSVKEPYVRATIPGTNVSSAYMEIINEGATNITLIGASAHISNQVEIHAHTMTNGMMKMQQRDALVISAKNKVVLQPSGYHLMIFDLKTLLADGEEISLTLHFKEHPDVTISVPVQSIKREKKSHHHHH